MRVGGRAARCFVSGLETRLTGLTIAAAGLLGVAVLFRLLAQSLRAFSRSDLQELCDDRGRTDRFGQILKDDEAATRVCEALGTLTLAGGLVAAAVAGGWVDLAWAASADPWFIRALAAALLAVTAYVVFIMLPWTLSTVLAERLLVRVWPLLAGLVWIFRPLTRLTELFTMFLHRVLDHEDDSDTADHISEEIASVVDEGERSGSLEQGAAEMIERVVELKRRDVLDVMQPRTDIIFMPDTMTVAEARQVFLDAGHSRIPVHGETQDEVLGIALAKDFLPTGDDDRLLRDVPDRLREPVYVPETMHIDKLLERIREERMHIALVLDEYGGVTGLVTLEDILEEIIGDISDETDRDEQEQRWVRAADGSIDVEARVHVDELNDEFDYDLPDDDDFDSIGGLVLKQLDRIPEVGESVDVAGLRIEVTEADKRRVVRVRVSETA